MLKYFSRRPRRLTLILLLGAIVVCGALGNRYRHLPQPVPTQVQREGMAIIKQELATLADSSFGRSQRGRALIAEIERLVESDRIVFSADLGGPRGLSLYNVFRRKRIYLKVIEMNHGRYLHQLPWQLSEVLFHEALHSLRAGFHSSSFEEECDAFAAGLQAEAASKGSAPDSVFRMDGHPLAKFVNNAYPGIRHDPGYQPVGESLEWLTQHIGDKHIGDRQDRRHSID